jgi:hypothetical protein
MNSGEMPRALHEALPGGGQLEVAEARLHARPEQIVAQRRAAHFAHEVEALGPVGSACEVGAHAPDEAIVGSP